LAKWADYLISAVRYDGDNSHIIKVKTHVDTGDGVDKPFEEKRETVISKLKNGKEYCTIIKKDGNWKRGQMVHIVQVKGNEYIRTDKNETDKDNLGSLPEF
jgi:hypothetical protein